MQVATPTVDGAAAADYVLSSTCAQPLAAGTTCAVSVSFVPGAAGVRQATLRIPSDGEPSPLSVTLLGTGAAPTAPLASPPVTSVAPSLSAFGATSRSFRVGARPKRASKKVKTGTALRLTLSAPAIVRFIVARLTTGRTVSGTCRAPSTRNRRKPSCTRPRSVGSFTRRLGAGQTAVKFSGMLAGKRLKVGIYRITAKATDATGRTSAAVTLDVHIVC